MIEIDRLDHLVLTVGSVEASVRFYTEVLGMQAVRFGKSGERWALAFGNQKFNLHETGKEFEPKAKNATSGSADLCLISSTPINDVIAHLKSKNVMIEQGPVARTGAIGEILSVYFRDPDGNLLEVCNYLSAANGNGS